jgi:hypothetical protein
VFVHIFRPPDFVLAELVIVYISGDVKHPRSEITIAAEQMPVLHDPQKGILHEVFAQFRIAGKSVEETIQRSFVPLKKQAEAIQISIPDLDHDGIVRKRFQCIRLEFQKGKLRMGPMVTGKLPYFNTP